MIFLPTTATEAAAFPLVSGEYTSAYTLGMVLAGAIIIRPALCDQLCMAADPRDNTLYSHSDHRQCEREQHQKEQHPTKKG